MNRQTTMVVGTCIGVGMGIGGALMYWFDPKVGSRRRAHARYKANRIARSAKRMIDTTSHKVVKISQGLPATAKSLVPAKAWAMLRA